MNAGQLRRFLDIVSDSAEIDFAVCGQEDDGIKKHLVYVAWDPQQYSERVRLFFKKVENYSKTGIKKNDFFYY